MTNKNLTQTNWNEAYQKGKYKNENGIKFLDDIIQIVKDHKLSNDKGYYPGCGNGRNFIPLWRNGLRMKGSDISMEAIKQLQTKLPEAKNNLHVGDFLQDAREEQYDYIISLQLFQHGDDKTKKQYIQRCKELLKPGGLLFLRVNSIHTDIHREHKVTQTNECRGITIKYREGEKTGQQIHFYSAEELHELLRDDFSIVVPLREEFMKRTDGSNSYWAQWETVIERR